MRMIKWPSIEQYRNVVRNVQHRAQFVRVDEQGEAVMNRNAVMPTLRFEGTVKLHGTNASVVVAPDCEWWAQSRENIITPEKDNAGFAMFAHANQAYLQDVAAYATEGRTDPHDKDIVIFGEWCGGNIQKGVAICQLPKMFVIFGIDLVDVEGNRTHFTRDEVVRATTIPPPDGIRVIYDFPTFTADIDFENPAEAQNALNAITEAVEAECPVGKALGVSGLGEGVVWRCTTPGYERSDFWFKVKGEKHSASKVKTLATVDLERLGSIQALAERTAHNGRLEQMHQQVFGTLNGGTTEVSRLGEFIKAVMGDVFKEDTDLIAASGFTGKELSGPCAKLCRNFIFAKLDEEAGVTQ